jgi:SAM-dependent methyltransferase
MKEIIYNRIGNDYNGTRCADAFITSRLIALLAPNPDGLYLDIGCGTGNYTIALAEKGFDFYGVEPSAKMLNEAQSNNNNIKWLLGTAEQIPLPDNFFGGAIGTLTLHHWKDLNAAFKELNRVLRKQATIVFLTATPEQMKGYWLNHYFPEMLHKSIIQMPSIEVLKENMIKNGFEISNTEKYFIPDDLQDCFLYVGKNKPELYLDERIRKGISSFSALANVEEVELGLSELESDIKTGKFEEIKRKYHNNLGDYLFISAKKK